MAIDRRGFLRPGPAVSAAGQVLGALDEVQTAALEAAASLAPPPPPGPAFAVLRFSRRAMATLFEVVLPFGTPDALSAAEEALEEIDRLESQLTVYRDTSEVSRLNRAAAYAAIPVEPKLFELLQTAAAITAATDGAFDVTAGALIKAWGFFRGPARVPEPDELAQALERTGTRHLTLDPDTRSVRMLRPGVEINLGSIGKGYALDRAAEKLRGRGNLSAALLHGGYSSLYAIGSEPGDERGWAVALTHPWQRERALGVVRLRDRALGTSAATYRHLVHQGRTLGHVLDPRTGWPARGIASASALAASAAEADALATAFYILGPERTRAYCDTRPDVGAVLLPEGDDARLILVGLAQRLVGPPS